MYRDLDPTNWPKPALLVQQQFIRGLLQDGFPAPESFLPDDVHLDDVIPVSKLDHVVDADASQTLAIEEVRQGRSLVIQGPPGTGKSQSITNLIATAVLDGKKVIFVAEKLAALEVVKRRLEREGLGALCLELHSNKSNKRAVIEEIGRTWKLGRPKSSDLESVISQLNEERAILNRHAFCIHEKHEPSGLTPFVITGHLARLGDSGSETYAELFESPETWTPEDRRNNRRLITELGERIDQIGLPSKHPWRGACRPTVLNIDLPHILKAVRSLQNQLSDLQGTSLNLAQTLAQPEPATCAETEEQLIIAEYVAKAPPLDKEAICNSVWNSGLDKLRDIVTHGRAFRAAVEETKGKVPRATWDKDATEIRSQIAAHGKSILRFLNGKYRSAIAELRTSVTIALPSEYSERLKLVDSIISGQTALRRIHESDSLGQEAFGATWRKEETNWDCVESILTWVARQSEAGLGPSFRHMYAGVTDQAHVGKLADQLRLNLAATREQSTHLFRELKLDHSVAFSVDDVNRIPLRGLAERCKAWLDGPEELSRWNNYFIRAQKARDRGLTGLVELLETGDVSTSQAIDCFDRGYFSQLLRYIVAQKPEIGQFDGTLHDKSVDHFRELDKQRLALAKYRTLLAHFEGMPPVTAGVGAAGIVKSEMERKRGHRTVRRLIKDAGSVVQAIKPVFMMSPLSVAQFLEPGAVEFDLLVIDEASQVQPVDAFGAMARCKQAVVVGDSKQLPPTRFFARITSNESSEEDEDGQAQAAQAQDIESILGLCRARGMPEKMLRWHYRSRHHSLIAVSNHEFYEDRLFIIPSPYSATAGLGLKFNHVPDGVFDSGATGTNRVEAKAVCRAVIGHARHSPNLTLGVAAFSVRQRQAILDELELLRRENPDTESFFSGHPTEPFFVKNLENVQGDERDVIFISVGYGKDVHGYMAMRFGPLSNEGGERRLNVLISRAKKRCEVFSSIKADDIDLERASGRGVAAFKTFLAFAETGRLAIARASGLDEESPFEEAVRRAVESLGYEVHPQVGVAGFFIDLGVLDRTRNGRYLIGIECDGAAYHSSRSARDRDRLRQSVLEAHGWIMHRIWSTDWFQRPGEQLRKVVEAIERAKVVVDEIKEPITPVVSLTVETDDGIERETILQLDNGVSGMAVPYKQARFDVPTRVQPHELATKDLSEVIRRIVECEGPVHEDEVVDRVRDLWGFARAGARIQEAVARGVRSLLATKTCTRDEGFLSLPNTVAAVRNREGVTSADLRKPNRLPPAEIRAAILSILEASHGAAKKEIPSAVVRMLGFKTTGAQLRAVIETQIERLLRTGTIVESNGLLKSNARPASSD